MQTSASKREEEPLADITHLLCSICSWGRNRVRLEARGFAIPAATLVFVDLVLADVTTLALDDFLMIQPST